MDQATSHTATFMLTEVERPTLTRASDAVAAALQAQRAFHRENWPNGASLSCASPCRPRKLSATRPERWNPRQHSTNLRGPKVRDVSMKIYIDPWKEGASEEEVEFKAMLKGRTSRGFDLVNRGDWEGVLKFWHPLENHAMFDVDFEAWRDRPYFRAQIQSGKCQTLIARMQLTQSSLQYMNDTISNLREVVKDRPYSMGGAASDRLDSADARVVNLNIKDTLGLVLSWTEDYWDAQMMATVSRLNESDIEELIEATRRRHREIESLLRQHPESSN